MMPGRPDALRNEPFRPLLENRGKHGSIDKRSVFDRRFPALSRACYLFLFPCSRFLAFMAVGYLIFAGSWFVYSNLPLVGPFLFTSLADILSLLPEGTAGIVLPVVALIFFIGIVPPVVIGGIVLPTVKAVMSLLDGPGR